MKRAERFRKFEVVKCFLKMWFLRSSPSLRVSSTVVSGDLHFPEERRAVTSRVCRSTGSRAAPLDHRESGEVDRRAAPALLPDTHCCLSYFYSCLMFLSSACRPRSLQGQRVIYKSLLLLAIIKQERVRHGTTVVEKTQFYCSCTAHKWYIITCSLYNANTL